MMRPTLAAGVVLWFVLPFSAAAAEDARDVLKNAVTFYASFDQELAGDYGGGDLSLWTRFDHPTEKGNYVREHRVNRRAFRITAEGKHGGALECVDVLPRRGRLYFPMSGKLAVRKEGWGGAVSFWLQTNPNTLLKTRFCDPVQITEKGAHNGAIWCDFPDAKPRDFRMGVFPALAEGEKPIPESDARAPLVRIKQVGFQADNWHHIVLSWHNFDTGQADGSAALYVDGKKIGGLTDRRFPMRWDLKQAGIYTAVSLIGKLDELALFARPLTSEEIGLLHAEPALLSSLGKDGQAQRQLQQFEQQARALQPKPAGDEQLAAFRAKLLAAVASDRFARDQERIVSLLAALPRNGPVPEPPPFPFAAEAARQYQQRYAKWAGLPLRFRNRAGMPMVLIPPGTFQMGSPESESGHRESAYDETRHQVQLTQPFYLAAHEVTVGQFRRFVHETGYVSDVEKKGGGNAHDAKAVWKHRPGTQWRAPGFAGPFELHESHPVVHVSHADARVFCEWLGRIADLSAKATPYMLPTEAQWEWASRAGSGDRFWWGPDLDSTGRVANVGDRALKQAQPEWPRDIMPTSDGAAFVAKVGSYRPNAFGLHDTLGNVWEFCATRYGPYPRERSVDPGDLDPQRGFAVRGGGWSNQPADVRCAARNADPPHFGHSNLGFRVAWPLTLTTE